MELLPRQINNDTGGLQVLRPSRGPGTPLRAPRLDPGLGEAKILQIWSLRSGRLPGSRGGCESFRLHLLFVFQEVSPLGEILHPLSWAVGLELALELLAGLRFVSIVIQTFPQVVPGVPAGLPFRRVWRSHRYLTQS